jgi:hypothetical protein
MEALTVPCFLAVTLTVNTCDNTLLTFWICFPVGATAENAVTSIVFRPCPLLTRALSFIISYVAVCHEGRDLQVRKYVRILSPVLLFERFSLFKRHRTIGVF